jgi:iron complex transport system substrate-binding protein
MSFSLPQGPQRIICLTEEPTEILYALGEEHRIVGISAYTERPAQARIDKPVVSAFIDGSVPKIVALKPDLIIGFSDIQSKLAAKLIAANQQVLIFNQRSIQEIFDVIVNIGRLVAKAEEAQELVRQYIKNIETCQDRTTKRNKRPRVYFEEWPDPMISGIQWVSELIEIAGGQDVFEDRKAGKLAKDRFVTSEEVIAADPEVFLASWCGKPFDRAQVESRKGWSTISALQTGRIHEIDACKILQPGPACLTDGLEALETAIHT